MTEKFTLQVTATFNAESYAKAQQWVYEQLMANEPETNMNIQMLQLVRWCNPATNKPIDPTQVGSYREIKDAP